jgi:hypothetical protein
VNLLAPAPFARFATRDGNFTADENGVVHDVIAGSIAMNDLLSSGCRHALPADAVPSPGASPVDPASV